MLSFLTDEQSLTVGSRRVQAQGNAAPIAVDEAVVVERGATGVTISVLGNDVDPEGQPLTLVSAFAALGTAVAEPDNTVTYTPPPAAAGTSDTVVYEIADVEDLRDTGQVNITIVEPDVVITTLPDQTFEVSAGALPIDIAVTSPAEFAGTQTVDLADLETGPINVVPPEISGTAEIGQVLTANPSLWIYDAADGAPTRTYQWLRGGADIPGETGATYTFQSGDNGSGIAVRETQTNAGGSRSAISAALALFLPTSDAGLTGWWDAADTTTITEAGGAVSSWAGKTAGPALVQPFGARQPTTGVRTLAGRNVLDFDGGDHLEQAISLPASGNMAFHMVLEIDTTTNAFEAMLAVDATNDFQIDSNNDTQFDGRFNAAGIGTTIGLTGGPFAGPAIVSVICDLTGAGAVEIFINGVSRGSAAYTTAIDTAVDLHLMTNRSRNAWLNGAVAELVVTETISNRSDYHGYLAAKWGIA